ncbi:MAG TPA: hypothetical protein VK181_07320 [Rhizobium sp.]|nr:hypothetical protein [Rhizobium sp.]
MSIDIYSDFRCHSKYKKSRGVEREEPKNVDELHDGATRSVPGDQQAACGDERISGSDKSPSTRIQSKNQLS